MHRLKDKKSNPILGYNNQDTTLTVRLDGKRDNNFIATSDPHYKNKF